MNLNLNGKWKVNFFPHKSSLAEILKPSFVPEGWLSADIPEDIHSTYERPALFVAIPITKERTKITGLRNITGYIIKSFFFRLLITQGHWSLFSKVSILFVRFL